MPTFRLQVTHAQVACISAMLLSLGSTQAQTPGLPPEVSSSQVHGLPDFSPLVEQVGPAVVNIRTVQKVRANGDAPELDDETRELLRRFGIPAPRKSPRRGGPDSDQGDGEPSQRGVGSGFIVSDDGFVLTNAHVVDGADDVFVRLTDKREFKAKVIGADKRSDVAVIKIEATRLPVARFGDVSRLKVGEWVIAIGSPFNLDNTVTAGIVSAKSRDTGDLLPLIQTDVAINPGNSGGPLINLRGEVVGINSQIYSRSGGYMGIAFAIPADEVQRIATQLRTTGRVIRGRIGVQIGEVTKEVAESLGLPREGGALVRALDSDGPAAQAGIEAGDIITRFDDQLIEKWNELPRRVGNTPPGSRHRLQVLRRGKLLELPVTVAELEPAVKLAASTEQAPPAPKPATRAHSLGLKVSDLSETQRKELKLQIGVRIESAEGAAAQAGLREGDILLSVGNKEVVSTRQLETLLEQIDRNRSTSVLYRRGALAQFAVIRARR